MKFSFIAAGVDSFIFFVRLLDIEAVIYLLCEDVVLLVVDRVDVDADVDALVSTWVRVK